MPGRIFVVAFSADGSCSRPAAASTARARCASTRRTTASGCRSSTGQKGGVFAVAFSPDGKAVASAGFDGVVRLNDPTTGKLVKEFVPVPGLKADDGGEVTPLSAPAASVARRRASRRADGRLTHTIRGNDIMITPFGSSADLFRRCSWPRPCCPRPAAAPGESCRPAPRSSSSRRSPPPSRSRSPSTTPNCSSSAQLDNGERIDVTRMATVDTPGQPGQGHRRPAWFGPSADGTGELKFTVAGQSVDGPGQGERPEGETRRSASSAT